MCNQSCLTLCHPIDCSPPGSSVHRIPQARMLEWVAMSSSRGSFLTQGSNLQLLHWQVSSLPLSHLGSTEIEQGLLMAFLDPGVSEVSKRDSSAEES